MTFRRWLANEKRGAKGIGGAILAADRSGNWWQLNADGSMLPGSALTMAATSSPGVSPLDTNGTSYFKSASVAYPTGDFSFVVSFRLKAVDPSGELICKWDGSTLAWTVEFAGALGPKFYLRDSVPNLAATAGLTSPQPGIWSAIAGTYTSATGGLVLRLAGTNATASTGGTGVVSSSQPHALGAQSAGGAGLLFSSRGAFYTEKVLTNADMDRIMAGVL